MKPVYAVMVIAGLALVPTVYAQQKPATAAEKEAAQQKSDVDPLLRMAAQQAEAVARAQQKVAEEAAEAARRRDLEAQRQIEAKMNELIPLELEVVISRYQGDKKVSSLPYSVAVNAGQRAEGTKLRMGANVPLPTSSGPVTPFNYQNIGTNIDCSARPLSEGRFVVNINVEERSVVQPTAGAANPNITAPVIRNFEAQNSLVLRDGQTRQFTAASDRVTGEVVKVDVTLKVLK